MNNSKPASILNRNFILLCCYTMFSSMPGLVLNSLLSSFAQQHLQVSLSLAGLLVSLNSITSLLTHPLVGPASNRIDKRLLLLVSAALSALSCTGFALCHQYALALVFRIMAGLSWALSAATGLVFASEMLPPEKATSGIAYYGLIQIVVPAIGPTLMLRVISSAGYTPMFLIMTGCAVASFVCVLFLPRSVSNADGRFRLSDIRLNEIFAPEAAILALIGGLFAFNNGVQSSYAISFATALGFGSSAGLYFILQAGATVITRFVLCRFLYKKSFLFVSGFAAALLVLFSLTMGFADSVLRMYAGGILMGIGYGCIIPVVQAACIRHTPVKRQGSAGSTYIFAINIGIGGGGLLGGTIAQYLGYRALFLGLLVPTLAAFVLSYFFGRFPASEE